MKKSKRQNVEEQLSQLPSLKDHQSRDVLYQAVNKKLERTEKRMPSWMGPGAAVCALLVVLAVFIPVFLSQNQEMNTQPSEQTRDEPARSFENPEMENSAGPSAEGEASDDRGAPLTAITEDEWFTFAYPGRNAEVVIPVFTHDEVPFTKETAEENGLSERLLQNIEIAVNEEEKNAEVTFPDEFNPAGSAYVQMLMESIRWELYGEEVQTIDLNRTSHDEVPMGNYGDVDRLTPIGEGEYIFKLYQYNEQSSFYLAPVPVTGHPSLEEALKMMKEEGGGTYTVPSVPAHVEFSLVEVEDGHVKLDISHKEWKGEREVTRMLDAISATARQFGMSRVTFHGIKQEESGGYDLTKPVDLPGPFNVEQ
ncbi:hypothetical protein [Halobacillus litoralis]|uniref:hypothetical protein n=1 Tax=Halobacillus litoralis TaxID=45668 RepID=UPI001CD270A6|nr:hypothetical protein [Halobacillus litoralis]MCA1022710.1 hypothetical protein [Halobacillus litoralis]